MMTRISFWMSCLVCWMILFSCQEKQPEGLLSKQQMVSALLEFYQKEARFNTLGVSTDSTAALMHYYKLKYIQQHNLNDSAIDFSYQYYLSKPKLLSEIYDQVIDSLALREQKADAPVEQ